MGKSLIIPGADFSENAISSLVKQWWIEESENYEMINVFLDNGVKYSTGNILAAVQGKDINIIRIPVTAQAGTIEIYVLSSDDVGQASIVDSIQVSVPLINTPTEIMLPKTLHVGNGQGLFINGAEILEYAAFSSGSSNGSLFYAYTNGSITQGGVNHVYGIDFGLISEE